MNRRRWNATAPHLIFGGGQEGAAGISLTSQLRIDVHTYTQIDTHSYTRLPNKVYAKSVHTIYISRCTKHVNYGHDRYEWEDRALPSRKSRALAFTRSAAWQELSDEIFSYAIIVWHLQTLIYVSKNTSYRYTHTHTAGQILDFSSRLSLSTVDLMDFQPE